MTPVHDDMVEPDITINGTALSFAQAMTVRVAMEVFALHVAEVLATPHSSDVYRHYASRLIEIRALIDQPQRDDGWRLGVGYIGADKRRRE